MKNYDVLVKNYICDVIDRNIVNLKKDVIHQSEMVCFCNGYIEGVGDLLFSEDISFIDKSALKDFAINYLHDSLKE